MSFTPNPALPNRLALNQDVALNNTQNDHILTYDATLKKWKNKASTGAGAAGTLIDQGAWSNSTTYSHGAVVTYLGNSYISSRDSNTATPATSTVTTLNFTYSAASSDATANRLAQPFTLTTSSPFTLGSINLRIRSVATITDFVTIGIAGANIPMDSTAVTYLSQADIVISPSDPVGVYSVILPNVSLPAGNYHIVVDGAGLAPKLTTAANTSGTNLTLSSPYRLGTASNYNGFPTQPSDTTRRLVFELVSAADTPWTPLGLTDHGALTGLTDDDHPQYLNNTRGDARYIRTVNGTAADTNGNVSISVSSGTGTFEYITPISATTSGSTSLDYNVLSYSSNDIFHTAESRHFQITGDTTITLYPPDNAHANYRREVELYFIKSDTITRTITIKDGAKDYVQTTPPSYTYSDRTTTKRIVMRYESIWSSWVVSSVSDIPIWGWPFDPSIAIPGFYSTDARIAGYQEVLDAIGLVPMWIRQQVLTNEPDVHFEIGTQLQGVRATPSGSRLRSTPASVGYTGILMVYAGAGVISTISADHQSVSDTFYGLDTTSAKRLVLHEFGHAMDCYLWQTAGKLVDNGSGGTVRVYAIRQAPEMIAIYNLIAASSTGDAYAKTSIQECVAQLISAYFYVPNPTPTYTYLKFRDVCNNDASLDSRARAFIQNYVLVP